MAWRTFSEGSLRIDVQLGDPVGVIVVGEVDNSSRHALREALESALAWPGSRDIEVNLRLARFVDEDSDVELNAVRERAHQEGRRFTIV